MTPKTEKSKTEDPPLLAYHLPRDLDESIRLNAQHYGLVARNGWFLHPKIQEWISGKKEVQIADVACGTGIWAFEVADQYPNAYVTGLDISTKQCPPEWSWPNNCRLATLDLTADVPPEYQGKFDVVNCRFLLIAGPVVDQRVFVKTFSKLLKPGGWLQWQEMAYPPGSAFSPIRDDAGLIKGYEEKPVTFDAIERVGSLRYKTLPVPRFGDWVAENSNFRDIEHIDQRPSPRHGRLESKLICGAVHGAAALMLQIESLDEATKEALRYEQGIGERCEADGVLCSWQLAFVLARAPED